MKRFLREYEKICCILFFMFKVWQPRAGSLDKRVLVLQEFCLQGHLPKRLVQIQVVPLQGQKVKVLPHITCYKTRYLDDTKEKKDNDDHTLRGLILLQDGTKMQGISESLKIMLEVFSSDSRF